MSEAKVMRLRMAPHFCDGSFGYDGGSHAGVRWETENGYTGGCSPDHWHASPEAALECFRGET